MCVFVGAPELRTKVDCSLGDCIWEGWELKAEWGLLAFSLVLCPVPAKYVWLPCLIHDC